MLLWRGCGLSAGPHYERKKWRNPSSKHFVKASVLHGHTISQLHNEKRLRVTLVQNTDIWVRFTGFKSNLEKNKKKARSKLILAAIPSDISFNKGVP